MAKKPNAKGLGASKAAPEVEHGAQFTPEVKNVIKLTLAFTKAVGKNQQDKSDNLVVSPYNALAALSMVTKGADGVTREELAKTLFGVKGKDLDKAANDYAALNNEVLAANKGQVELTTANGVWTNQDLIEVHHVRADRCHVEIGWRQRGNLAVFVAGDPGEILRDVAFVGAHRVRRDVAIELEVGEKRLQMVAQVHASRSASARSAIISFFFILSRGMCSSGGMMPCVMLVGW